MTREHKSGPLMCTTCRLPLLTLRDMHTCVEFVHPLSSCDEYSNIGFILGCGLLENDRATWLMTRYYQTPYGEYTNGRIPAPDAELALFLDGYLSALLVPQLLNKPTTTQIITGDQFAHLLLGLHRALQRRYSEGLPFVLLFTLVQLARIHIIPLSIGSVWDTTSSLVGEEVRVHDRTGYCAYEALRCDSRLGGLHKCEVTRTDQWIDAQGALHPYHGLVIDPKVLALPTYRMMIRIMAQFLESLNRVLPRALVHECAGYLHPAYNDAVRLHVFRSLALLDAFSSSSSSSSCF